MPKLELYARFLGDLKIFNDTGELTIKPRKARALFIYLVLNSAPISREHLTELFWPNGNTNNLRQAVYSLRKLDDFKDYLVDKDGSLAIYLKNDVKDFEQAVYNKNYSAALSMYSGKLLKNSNFTGLSDFNNWLEIERNRLEQIYLKALNAEVQTAKELGNYQKALKLNDKILEIDIINESAYKTAMQLAAYLNKPEQALGYYQNCLINLEKHLQVKPLAATQELAEQISQAKFKKPSALKALSDNEFQLIAAILIANTTNANMLEPILAKDALEISQNLSKLESRGVLDKKHWLKESYLEEFGQLLKEPLKKLLHFRTAEYLVKNKADDGIKIAKHYLAANEAEKAAPIFLAAAQKAQNSSQESAKELCFLALWTNTKTENRYHALELIERLAESLGEKDLQAKALEELKDISWQLQDDIKLCQSKLRQARYNMREAKLTQAISLSQEALKIAKRIKDLDLELQAYNNLGASYFHANRLNDAYKSFSKVLLKADSTNKLTAANNLGAIAGIQNNLELSYQHFQEALTYARQAKNISLISACLNNLANTAEKLADYQTAEKHYLEVLSLLDRNKDPHLETIALCNLALSHSRQGRLGLAWNTSSEAFELAEEKKNELDMIIALSNKINIAIAFGDFGLAQKLAQENYSYSQQNTEKRRALVAEWNLEFSKQLNKALFNKKLLALSQQLVANEQLDVAIWAYLEMALHSKNLEQCLELSKIAQKYASNRHHFFILDLISLKLALLKTANTEDIVHRLEPMLGKYNYAELPLAYLLISQSYQKTSSKKSSEYQVKAIEILEIQAQGLPKQHKQSHMEQIKNWQII